MVMRVFVAGGSGVLGRRLVPQLVARGHEVTATTTTAAKLGCWSSWARDGVVMDGLDAAVGRRGGGRGRPDAIVHQMTGLSEAHAGKPNLRQADRFFATTNRLRSEGIDHLLAAAEATGVSHVVAQGHASMNGIREGGWVKTEEDPLEVCEGTAAIDHLEDGRVAAGGAVLRYGGFYGPGAIDDQVELVRKRHVPLVGRGTGYSRGCTSTTRRAPPSWRGAEGEGVFNIVDDEPAPVSEWLPYLAECAGRKRPRRSRVAGPAAGRRDGGGMMTEGRGFSNAKAKRELGWQLRYPSWRQGFQEELHDPDRGVRGAAAATVRDRLPDSRQRGRAEDAVQETWLRYQASPTQPTSAKAFLSAVVTRISIDVLRSARVRREEYAGQWLPSRCSPTPTRTRSGRRSWPTRCRWRRCYCSSGSARSSGRSSCCGSVRVRLPRDRVGSGDGRRRRAASSRCERGATWTRAAPVRGGPPGARGAGVAVLRRAPRRRRRRPAGAARRRRRAGRATAAARARAGQERRRADNVARVLPSRPRLLGSSVVWSRTR
jgi:nucleoside-diphosphate-sugar epimerase